MSLDDLVKEVFKKVPKPPGTCIQPHFSGWTITRGPLEATLTRDEVYVNPTRPAIHALLLIRFAALKPPVEPNTSRAAQLALTEAYDRLQDLIISEGMRSLEDVSIDGDLELTPLSKDLSVISGLVEGALKRLE